MRPNVVVSSSSPGQMSSGSIPSLLLRVALEQSGNMNLCSFKVNQHLVRRVEGVFLHPVQDDIIIGLDDPFNWYWYL